MEQIKTLGISVIRTIVPMVVGQVMTWLAVIGVLDVNGEVSAALISTFTILFTAFYYAAVRYLEVNFSAKFGWLLGVAKAPEYKA